MLGPYLNPLHGPYSGVNHANDGSLAARLVI